MKKFIIITSISQPTKAVHLFAKIKDWQLIVVGDRKTPSNWKHQNVIYISPEQQIRIAKEFSKNLPWNHYSRKMIGYIYALQNKADIIADTDDDNIPMNTWGTNIKFEGKFKTISNNDYINVYQFFTEQKIWPRGYPLTKILNNKKIINKNQQIKIGIWQQLADGDTDVDAIYRLTNNQDIKFADKEPVILQANSICPFNSQNTFFRKELFPLLYLPAYVTFRFTDILRGLIAQPIMWAAGYHLGFDKATVLQERNPHNYLKDFESEIPMYLNTEKVINILKPIIKKQNSITQNLKIAYDALIKEKIVSPKEKKLLNEWLKSF
ncbi:MAG: STELLO glycosyltransferase family protein [Flavobacteriaceae bacterium]|jgi:hypothetical protein|nr:STELLO glycosyltransferase family protein [Flavobacteriaceae bacterium]